MSLDVAKNVFLLLLFAAIVGSSRDRERMEGTGDEDDAHMHDIDVEELLQDYEGKNSWEKLTKFIQALQDNYGEEEVDNVDVEEFGPHLRCNNTWRIGPFAAECWSVPWKERKIIGTLEFPNGKTCALREGDLPNRNPYVPDDLMMPEDRVKQLPKYTTDRLNRTTGIDLRQYDVAERDVLFNDARGASAFGISDTLTTSAPGATAAHEDMQMEMV
eukprot:CAMPEP_0179406720 /NCGR_PEP_ID=MMETSP0799-20121207/1067_1 /TAXON_ID=46947 /ORGANISM="Geminigera cryophila, Strain CCMP2564" /LENGTH=215 /DNA_ID=CAMNT_0021177847 /DNA_START=272 /DNA_END=916 /DNA_ORIENTATION=+